MGRSVSPETVTESLRRRHPAAGSVAEGHPVNLAGLVSIPFVGPPAIRATVATALLSEGVDVMSSGLKALRHGTPVYVRADCAVEEVVARLKELSVKIVPVIEGLDLLGFLDLSSDDSPEPAVATAS